MSSACGNGSAPRRRQVGRVELDLFATQKCTQGLRPLPIHILASPLHVRPPRHSLPFHPQPRLLGPKDLERPGLQVDLHAVLAAEVGRRSPRAPEGAARIPKLPSYRTLRAVSSTPHLPAKPKGGLRIPSSPSVPTPPKQPLRLRRLEVARRATTLLCEARYAGRSREDGAALVSAVLRGLCAFACPPPCRCCLARTPDSAFLLRPPK